MIYLNYHILIARKKWGEMVRADNKRLLAKASDQNEEMQLWEVQETGAKEYELIINGIFIMASYNNLSSELLIRESMKLLTKRANVDILIGGLGMGFTVKEACSYRNVKSIDVVEVGATIVEWNKSYLTPCNRGCLKDGRVQIFIDDFYNYVQQTQKKYDIISMDIDNGPMMLVRSSNYKVYQDTFFAKIKELLKPCGVFTLWSCNQDKRMLKQLQHTFSTCREEVIKERVNEKMLPYYVYLSY